MSNLPAMHQSPAPQWQRERLCRWLQEWDIERQLVAPEGPEDDAEEVAYAMNTAPALRDGEDRPPAEAGQLRLLQPEQTGGATRPVYIAVLEQNAAGRFVVAPYGLFNEPAIPGELKTTREEPCLQVLCLWQAREMGAEALSQSWLVGELTEDDRDDARAIHGFIQSGAAMPSRLVDRVGPPLIHPCDPRHEYLGDEEERVFAAESGPEIMPRTQLARAAEQRARYGAGIGARSENAQ